MVKLQRDYKGQKSCLKDLGITVFITASNVNPSIMNALETFQVVNSFYFNSGTVKLTDQFFSNSNAFFFPPPPDTTVHCYSLHPLLRQYQCSGSQKAISCKNAIYHIIAMPLSNCNVTARLTTTHGRVTNRYFLCTVYLSSLPVLCTSTSVQGRFKVV